MFGALLIERGQGGPLLCSERFDLPGALQRALRAMESIGGGTRIASRCIKYLKKLFQVAGISRMSEEDSDASICYLSLTN